MKDIFQRLLLKYEALIPEDQLLFKKSMRPKKPVIEEEEEKVINPNHSPALPKESPPPEKPKPIVSPAKVEGGVIKKELPKIIGLKLDST